LALLNVWQAIRTHVGAAVTCSAQIGAPYRSSAPKDSLGGLIRVTENKNRSAVGCAHIVAADDIQRAIEIAAKDSAWVTNRGLGAR
jgi:hypothetical protein